MQTIRNKDKIEVEFSAKAFQNFSFYKSSFAQTYKTNTFNFLNFNQEFNEPNLKNATTNAVYPSTYSNTSLGYFANLGLSNVSNSISMDYATKYTKFLNLTSYANSNTLTTPYGEVSIFYDEFDDNDKLGFGTFASNSLLFNFDSNGDGFVNANDKLFNKLKVRGYDINGNEKIAKLSDVMPSINLRVI